MPLAPRFSFFQLLHYQLLAALGLLDRFSFFQLLHAYENAGVVNLQGFSFFQLLPTLRGTLPPAGTVVLVSFSCYGRRWQAVKLLTRF